MTKFLKYIEIYTWPFPYRPWYHPEIPIPARDVKAIYQFLCHVLPTIVYVMQIRKENN